MAVSLYNPNDSPLTKVLGDVAWLHLFRSEPYPRDQGQDTLAPYRRVRRSECLRLQGGTWALARFVRNAVGDIARFPLEIPIDLRGQMLQLGTDDEAGSSDHLSQPPFCLRISTSGGTLSVSAWKIELAFAPEVADWTPGNPAIPIRITAHVTPSVDYKLLKHFFDSSVSEDTITDVVIATNEDELAKWDNSQQISMSVKPIKAIAGPLPSRPFPVLYVTSSPEDVPSSALFDSQLSGKVLAQFLRERARDGNGRRLPPVLQLPPDQKVHFPASCDLGFGIYTASTTSGHGQLGPTLSSHAEYFAFGTCELNWPAGRKKLRIRFKFDYFKPAILSHIRFDVPKSNSVVLPTTVTPQQQRVIALWKERSDRKQPRLSMVQTYTNETAAQPVCAWWEMHRGDNEHENRLGRVFGYDPDTATERLHPHGGISPDLVPTSMVRAQARHLVFLDLDFGFRINERYKYFETSSVSRDQLPGPNWALDEDQWQRPEELQEPSWIPAADWVDALRDWRQSPEDQRGLIFVNLARALPITRSDTDISPTTWDRGDMWDVLRNATTPAIADGSQPTYQFRDRVVVIVSAHLLRASGARISHRLSWEYAATDCWQALGTHPRFRPLLDFGHLIVRFGCVGAFLYDRKENTKHLLFDVAAKNGFFRDAEEEGRVLGNNSILTSCLLRSVLKRERDERQRLTPSGMCPCSTDEALRDGIRDAIPTMQRLHRGGYDKFQSVQDFDVLDYQTPDRIFCELDEMDAYEPSKELSEKNKSPVVISEVEVPENIGWSIIDRFGEDDLLRGAITYVQSKGIPPKHFKKRRGRDSSPLVQLNSGKSTVFVPIAQIGQFIAVAREEIEAYRSIQAILRRYVQHPEGEKPISIAVFGPPGSGKSFGIKSVAKAIGKDDEGKERTSWHEFNLAQFSSPNDIVIPLLKARDVEGTQVPVIFFDEFDSRLAGVDLGWLRYFLQPMQDGTFKHGEDVRKVGRAIFVFAGGTSESFKHFSREESSTEQEKADFRLAKGPDFVSRLSGYIDTFGINQRKGLVGGDSGFVLRRAVLLRSFLEQRRLIGDSGRAVIDDDLIRALLEMREFKHGARSLEILLKMCIGEDGMVRLPSLGQLEMHVDPQDAKRLWTNVFPALHGA
jgi:hypothetical protein